MTDWLAKTGRSPNCSTYKTSQWNMIHSFIYKQFEIHRIRGTKATLFCIKARTEKMSFLTCVNARGLGKMKMPQFFSPLLSFSMPQPLPDKKHMKEAMQQQNILTFQALPSHMPSTRLNYTFKMHYRCSSNQMGARCTVRYECTDEC